MSMLGSWGVSGPRFDTVQDWTSLANVKPTPAKSALRRSASSGSFPSPAAIAASGLTTSPSSAALLAHTRLPGTSPHGTGRIPSTAFSSNPYQVNRAQLSSAIAQTLSTGGAAAAIVSPSSASSPSQFAIHQLPRARGHSASSARIPIAIPLGSPLPLSPASAPGRRSTGSSQQRNLAHDFSAAGSANYNPYLLTESASTGSLPTPTALVRRTKNLEQRLADYLKPTRSSPNHKRASSEWQGRNISVNVVPHPKSPLASLLAPNGGAFKPTNSPSPAAAHADEAKEASSPTNKSPGGRRKAIFGNAADGSSPPSRRKGVFVAYTDGAAPPRLLSKKKKTMMKYGEDGDEEWEASEESSSSMPASMNLRAVLRAQKEQEAAAAAEAEKEKESKKPLSGISWSDILQAKNLLQTRKDKTISAADAKSHGISPLALQVATQWLSASRGGPKKAFNVYSLSEYQRSEYKLAVEQGKWLTMYPKEEMARKGQEPELIPNDQKRVSSKTRLMNLAKGDTPILAGGGSNNGANGVIIAPLLYNTYVSCNGQYGYVRWVGRAPWGPGQWVGMELVERHPYASFGAWVDFYHETSAIMMQMVEEPAGEKKKKAAANAAEQTAIATGPAAQMMINISVPRPLLLAAMVPPVKDRSSKSSEKNDKVGEYQPLSNSVFPFIEVAAFLRESLTSCFEMQDLDAGLVYFAPLESVKRVAQKAKIDSKTLLHHKEHQTNPFADVDELACSTPKKHEGTPEMLARYLTVSDREVLDGERNKARSIFRWICHNIRYDPLAAKATDVAALIRARKATSEGFAILFHALATLAGLQCMRIRGVEKQLNQKTDQVLRNKHAWNAIKVDGEWSFIDCVFSSCQFVAPDPTAKAVGGVAPTGSYQQMFSDAYFCTPPSLFILEHFPTDAFGDNFSKLLPAEYNNLQMLRTVVSASEFEKGLIPGRAFVEYQMRSGAYTYAVECKQPSYQIEITAPSFILFDVELRLKSHTIDLSQASHVQYDGEQVTIYLIFPVPGEYICRITCKPSWRELDIYDSCLTYRLSSTAGLVPLASNKDVIIGFMQHRKVNARDTRALFNRHFTLLHPLSGHLLPKAPFIVQVKGPDIADSVVVACNGDWQRLSSTSLTKGGVRMFEGTCIIQPRYELQIFYEMDRKFHLLFQYKANLTSFSNVYQEKTRTQIAAGASAPAANTAPEIWHGKCSLGIEGRVFDANLSLDVPNCRFGRSVCTFVVHCSIAWDIALQVQEGWRNGTPLSDQQVVVEEVKAFRTNLMTQYKITATLPLTAAGDAKPTTLLRASTNELNKQPTRAAPADHDDAPRATTQFTLVINARNIKQGGPMRYCLSYFFDVSKSGPQPAANSQSSAQIELLE